MSFIDELAHSQPFFSSQPYTPYTFHFHRNTSAFKCPWCCVHRERASRVLWTGASIRLTTEGEAIRLNPNHARPYYGRALIKEERNDHSAAIADFQRHADLGGKRARR